MWLSPPEFLTDQSSQSELTVSFFISGLIFLFVGLYMSRRAYIWSE